MRTTPERGGPGDDPAGVIVEADPPVRAEAARRVCAALGWHDTLGRPKLMSCRVGLLRLHPAGPDRAAGGTQRQSSGPGPAIGALAEATTAGWIGRANRSALGASRLWNGLIERGHYLGYTALPGAQLRYLIVWDYGVLGALGFGAAAWKVAARDARSYAHPTLHAGGCAVDTSGRTAGLWVGVYVAADSR